MAKIILIQALPAPHLDSRENLVRALKLLEGCEGRKADLICFPEYFPFSGEEELAAAAARLQAYIVAGLVEKTQVDLIVNPAILPILRGHWHMGALTRVFDYYVPVVGVNTATAVVEIAGRHYALQGGGSFAIQPPVPANKADLAKQVLAWDDLTEWIVLRGGEPEARLTVNLDLDGPRRWRPAIRQRFGIKTEVSELQGTLVPSRKTKILARTSVQELNSTS